MYDNFSLRGLLIFLDEDLDLLCIDEVPGLVLAVLLNSELTFADEAALHVLLERSLEGHQVLIATPVLEQHQLVPQRNLRSSSISLVLSSASLSLSLAHVFHNLDGLSEQIE